MVSSRQILFRRIKGGLGSRLADAPPRARIQAADILLDRGWGKPAPTPPGEDDKDIRITLRQTPMGGDKDCRRCRPFNGWRYA